MPILMAVAVVLTANHYILDVIVGVSLVLVAHVAALALERRRHRRRSRRIVEERIHGLLVEDSTRAGEA
jgi:membrane-associated phospholipid phosphatase